MKIKFLVFFIILAVLLPAYCFSQKGTFRIGIGLGFPKNGFLIGYSLTNRMGIEFTIGAIPPVVSFGAGVKLYPLKNEYDKSIFVGYYSVIGHTLETCDEQDNIVTTNEIVIYESIIFNIGYDYKNKYPSELGFNYIFFEEREPFGSIEEKKKDVKKKRINRLLPSLYLGLKKDLNSAGK